ncbi:MAG: glycosyltransferase family 39 protein [Candidatus Nealsonbacteria bacterium]
MSGQFSEIFSKNWFAVFSLTSLLLFQLILSFIFPACGLNDSWQPVGTYLPKFTVESADNLILGKVYPLISSEYRLNSDVGHYLELARNFNPEVIKGHVLLDRPLYSFLIYLGSLPARLFTDPSYGTIFGFAILVNFILLGLAVILFFRLLKNLFSSKVAWLSSILLIFSPFVHTFLVQPRAEMLTAFTVVLSCYLLYNYVKRASVLKLVIFSLVIGVLMLGKMFFAVAIFILLLGVFFKRHKEAFIFLIIHLIPLGLWYLWVTKVWQIPYYAHDVQYYQGGIFLLNVFQWPWYRTFQTILTALPNFISGLIYSFVLVPVIFSVIGFRKLIFKSKNIFYFGSIFSVFLFCFLVNIYYYRIIFLLFPVIYLTAVLGMEEAADRLKRYRPWLAPLFYVIIISLITFVSSINIYRVFDYSA